MENALPLEDQHFVVMRGIERGNRFITSYYPQRGDTPESIVVTNDGKVSYELEKITKTIAEAQVFLFGYATSTM